MATRAIFTPLSAEFPSSNPAALSAVNARPVLAFDTTTSETCYWTFVAPQGLTGTLTLVLSYMMASATSGGVAFSAAIEAVTSGDATDLDSTTSFDSVNTATDTVPSTAGYMKQISITLTNKDSIAAADLVRVSLARAVANASDTAAGDCYILAAELRDAA